MAKDLAIWDTSSFFWTAYFQPGCKKISPDSTKTWPLATILNFGSFFKKSLAHPYVGKNATLKLQKKIDQTIFLRFSSP